MLFRSVSQSRYSGFGDVVPGSPIGECFVVLVSISSTLYVSLLIGLLLSRYIAARTRRSIAEVSRGFGEHGRIDQSK